VMRSFGPWAFDDAMTEKRYRVYFTKTQWDRSRLLGLITLVVMWFCVGANFFYTFFYFNSLTEDSGQFAGITIRLCSLAFGTTIFMVRWSDAYKTSMACAQLWMMRFGFVFAAAVEAGLKQPDSNLKVTLLCCLCVGGFIFPTFTEYICGAFVVGYLQFFRLLLLGGPCPCDSSRNCTASELLEHFGHHTLYLAVAFWIHFHTHSDRRQDFIRRESSSRARRAKESSHEPGTDQPLDSNKPWPRSVSSTEEPAQSSQRLRKRNSSITSGGSSSFSEAEEDAQADVATEAAPRPSLCLPWEEALAVALLSALVRAATAT
jgi:hypothetical protein